MQIWIKRLVIVVILLGAIGGAYALTQKNGKKKDQVTYEFGNAATGDVRSFVTATGVVQPWKIVDIKSNVAGRIDKLTVDLGDAVKAGQLIMAIDPTDTTAAKDQAQADLNAADAKLAQAQVTVTYQEKQVAAKIAAAQKAVLTSQAKLAQAKSSMNAQPKLTAASVAGATAALVSARKTKNLAEKTREQLKSQLSQLQDVTIPNTVINVGSSVEQAKANMTTAQSDYRRQRSLQSLGYVAKADVKSAYARMSTMEANYRTAQQRLKNLEQENSLTVDELQSRIRGAQDSIEEAEARINQARATLDLANDNQFQDEVKRQEYTAAKAGLDQAGAELDAALAEKKQIDIKKKDVTGASAQIVRSRATLQQATINAGYTQITAPRSGVIITKNVEQGTIVPSSRGSIGSTNALIQIGDTTRLWVVCNVDETDIGQVSVDQKVTVKVDAYPSLLIDGKVIRIDPQAKVEQNVTLIPVTVELSMPDPRFKPLMNATCEFIVDEALGVLTVPNEAIKERAGGEGEHYVQKLVNGKVQDVPVEVGLAGPDATQIKSGLNDGDQVITKTVVPEKEQTNNPFNPFGGMGGPRNNARPGGGGGRGGR